MLRCKGVFYSCKDGAEARRLNRLLIEAGMIRGFNAGSRTSGDDIAAADRGGCCAQQIALRHFNLRRCARDLKLKSEAEAPAITDL